MKSAWDEWGGVVYFFGFIGIILVLAFWSNISSVIAGRGWDPHVASSCKDVTSYDHNWSNDMLCTRTDGSTFYTDYSGAKSAIAENQQANGSTSETVSTCDSNYSGACVPIVSDVDCAGGCGNGPGYVSGPVDVIGSDVYSLDRDNDGIGCE